MRFVGAKLALEAIALHPVSLFAFFGCMGAAKGQDSGQIMATLRADFWPTLGLEVALWTPLDAVIFFAVPVRLQVLAINCGCFVESVALSWIHAVGLEVPPWARGVRE